MRDKNRDKEILNLAQKLYNLFDDKCDDCIYEEYCNSPDMEHESLCELLYKPLYMLNEKEYSTDEAFKLFTNNNLSEIKSVESRREFYNLHNSTCIYSKGTERLHIYGVDINQYATEEEKQGKWYVLQQGKPSPSGINKEEI